MAADRAGALLDFVGQLRLALVAQRPDVGGQHLQRRLQAVRQIGGARAGPRKRLLLRLEQAIDLVGERLHFAWRRHVEPRRSARDHVADRDPQALQRREADGDLDEERRDQDQREQHEGWRKLADIFADRHLDGPVVLRHHGAKRSSAGVDDRALDGDQQRRRRDR